MFDNTNLDASTDFVYNKTFCNISSTFYHNLDVIKSKKPITLQ